MTGPGDIGLAEAREHGLTESEWQHVLDVLGRAPTWAELGVLSVMWSEHCSYKSSRRHLRKLPTEAPWVIEGPGENAGVIDVGEGLAACFKMESHNHPSFIEPYQGAATGVGGIMRDIFTMGARPVASLNSLRFGRPEAPRMRFLVEGVVAGIGGYGNCMGVPTVGGEVAFDASYDGNILVNAFTLGLLPRDRIFRSAAAGVGNSVMYVGSKTGRDGIHGATMASEEFGAESEAKRPRVQVGDPFTEKKLLEACLELMREDAIIAIQDMGAAGLTSSSCEMASKGEAGIEIDVARVPRREEGMTPYEVLLSESQERMLMVVRPGTEAKVEEIFSRWELDAAVIGRVTDTHCVVVKDGEEEVARLPVSLVVDDAPSYDRPTQRPDLEALWELPEVLPLAHEGPGSAESRLLGLLAQPTVASKRWVYEQYDWSVRASTVHGPGAADAAVIRLTDGQIRPSPQRRGLAMTVDMNGRYVRLDPRRGAALGVLEAARNLVCVGARPRATTDCLNFGNPEKPEVMWTFVESILGLADGCRAVEAPIVSGNVSLYNETEGRPILPTPTVGMVGVVEDVTRSPGSGFRSEGDAVILLGTLDGFGLGGSELVLMEHGELRGRPAEPDFEAAARVHRACLEAIGRVRVASAHDLSEGGLLVALAESAIGGGRGAQVALPFVPSVVGCFGEGPSAILLSTPEPEAVLAVAEEVGAPAVVLGEVGGDRLVVEGCLDVDLTRLKEAWEGGLQKSLQMVDDSAG
ncbi:MAG: phosphoribosylformylglycinamidine synthase subunit PurL [Myxococcota bacterium]